MVKKELWFWQGGWDPLQHQEQKPFLHLVAQSLCVVAVKRKNKSLIISRLTPQMITLNAVIKIEGKFTYS